LALAESGGVFPKPDEEGEILPPGAFFKRSSSSMGFYRGFDHPVPEKK
jgi:hypothetical protein